ncbi:proprotein convertase subtilisin/kexin type 7-like [Saccostrea echinata]|uniref:proprotein convertase subtilisin/kexin type 7-like n=1 Tax=Saccostrea echinata TaxID=191078 RepID=UPI002A7F329C|nr:proprotein convertase subtilisin/kexin type 7-like [Saccostrea echinata]
MPVDHGSFFQLFVVSNILLKTIICEFTKEIPFPKHVDNVDHSLIWAVKVKDVGCDIFNLGISRQSGITKNDHDDVVFQFSYNSGNKQPNFHLAQKITNDCKLIYIETIDILQDTYLLGFDIDKLHHFDSNYKNSSSILKSYSTLHTKLLHDHYIQHVPDLSFNFIRDSLSQCLEWHPMVEWYSQQNIRRRTKREIDLHFVDPFFKLQWHLINNKRKDMDINVTGVWERNITGQGVTVAVVDDGVEWNNLDLKDNYNRAGSWDLNSNDPDPSPSASKDSNHHGTRCAGEIAAVPNSYCAVGVAYRAQFSGLKVLDGPMTDSLEAQAFNKHLQINDIYSCSWGPDDDGKTVDGPHVLAKAAMQYGIDFGRNGFGSIFVVASGNGGHFQDNCNYDGYANSIYTVTVGAVDEDGNMPFYAEKCASMLAVTFSSGTTKHRSIVTTDWTLKGGGGCTTTHSGTSAAAPLAAGMLALMLQARPCLTWRDIQYLIIMTAQKVDIDHSEWKKNQAGLYHSHKHGFGLMKAWRLVNAAKVWETVPWITSYLYSSDEIHLQIPKGTNQHLTITHTVTEEDITGLNLFILEHIQLFVTITHPCRGKLEIVLICPSGTHSIVATPRAADRSDKGFQDWAFSTVRCWGEDPVGVWNVTITDHDTRTYGAGYVQHWKLKLYGTWITKQQFANRKRRIEEAMDGRFLNDSYQLPCPKVGPDVPPKHPLSPKLLKFLVLASIFCLVMALYETFEYAVCYRDEKKAQRQKMMASLQTQQPARNKPTDEADQSESQRLLDSESDTAISMETFDVREVVSDFEDGTDNQENSELQQLIND